MGERSSVRGHSGLGQALQTRVPANRDSQLARGLHNQLGILHSDSTQPPSLTPPPLQLLKETHQLSPTSTTPSVSTPVLFYCVFITDTGDKHRDSQEENPRGFPA